MLDSEQSRYYSRPMRVLILQKYMNRPLALVCYICGRQFGTKSLGIHIKACEKKWENEQNQKPPKQRRPCPRPPPGFKELISKDKITRADINNFNTKSFDTFVEEGLVECQYCGRKFNQKSLVPHQKACKKDPMIKKPFVNKGALGKYSEQPDQPISSGSYGYKFAAEDCKQEGGGNLVPCRRCGRTFNADRLGKHQRVCKGERVGMKPKHAVESVKPQPSKMKPNFGVGKKAKWQIQHEEFQAALKAMRQVKAIQQKGGKLSDLPPPPPSNYDHYVQCRHCGRKYAPEVAERHIPKCANIINKPGGIQKSKIQDKYIAGTGAGKVSNSTTIPYKPNLSSQYKATNSSSYGQSQSYGGYNNSSALSYGNPSHLGGSGYGMAGNSSKMGMGSSAMTGTSSSKMGMGASSSAMKPNLKTKSGVRKGW